MLYWLLYPLLIQISCVNLVKSRGFLHQLYKYKIFSVLPISESEVEECYRAIKDHALLTNDAFHVATMKGHGITDIATNDPDFDRVEWLNVWKP